LIGSSKSGLVADGEAKLMIVSHSARGRSISLASLDLARAGRFCIEAPPQPLRIDRTTDALVAVGYGPTQARLGDKLCLRRRTRLHQTSTLIAVSKGPNLGK
jgi:hypothetical protein